MTRFGSCATCNEMIIEENKSWEHIDPDFGNHAAVPKMAGASEITTPVPKLDVRNTSEKVMSWTQLGVSAVAIVALVVFLWSLMP